MPTNPIQLPDQLETPRLIVRPYRITDAPRYLTLCLNNKTHLLPYEAGNPALSVNSLEDAESLMRDFAGQWTAHRIFFMGAWDKTSDELVAQVVVMVVNWDLPEFELGFFADQDHQGQGFVTEAAQSALGLAFDYLGAERVSARCSEDNRRSQRVLTRCGFTHEGHLRRSNPYVRRDDGAPSGTYVYGLLRSEFAATTDRD